MDQPRKQEQEPASPEITEVAPAVLRLQLPINFDGLGHVNTYVIEDSSGVAVVDPGLPGRASWRALRSRLGDAGIKLSRVHTVIVTHSHPDHFGGAGLLARESGASLVAQSAFTTWSTRDDHGAHCSDEDTSGATQPVGAEIEERPWSRETPWGTRGPRPPRRQRVMFWAIHAGLLRSFVPPRPSRRVDDGDVLSLGGREWFCFHTPGHTLDHLCLYDPAEQVLLAGDHVLPTITPHVPGLDGGSDPLATFVASLDKIGAVGEVSTVLPAHGHPFHDLPGRIEEIKLHHEQRLDRVREIAAALGPATVVSFSRELFRPSRWGPMAESETYAHLEHLRLAGEAHRDVVDGQLLYRVESEPKPVGRGVGVTG